MPYIGHALEACKAGLIQRAMIIGKGSLFLGRLTNLADGASSVIEASSGRIQEQKSFGKDEVVDVLLEALGDLASSLQKV